MNWKEEFDKEFVRMTNPSTIGSGRSEMVASIKILNVRKPERIIAFISTQLEKLIDEIPDGGNKAFTTFKQQLKSKYL